ncbi:MAG: helix-turn-helix domain-containing protein [Bacillota bacterium]
MADEKLALSVKEAAQRLGLSQKALYAHLAAGRLPCIRLGRRRLIPVAALERWLEEAGLRGGGVCG